jgi:hypothetical protein
MVQFKSKADGQAGVGLAGITSALAGAKEVGGCEFRGDEACFLDIIGCNNRLSERSTPQNSSLERPQKPLRSAPRASDG